MAQVLYRKWRPVLWQRVVGQDHVIETLKNAVAADRIAHAYLFAGPRGTGKTTTARLLAKAANCLHEDLASRPCNECDHCIAVNEGRFLDLIEIDAASNTSVDDVRDLREKINFSPNRGRYKVYIIDEVHMLSTAAFNALLKTLEEPPPHAIFVLATTEVHKIPATVLSRCQRHEFRRIPLRNIVEELEWMVEGEEIDIEPAALSLIAKQATGSLRDAISLLDQLASTGQEITLALAESVLGTAANQAVLEVVDALLAGLSGPGLDAIRTTLDGGSDPRQFARQIVDYLRGVLLVRMGNAAHIDATAEVRAIMARHAQTFPSANALLEVIRSFQTAAVEMRWAWQPSLPLELAFVESLQAVSPGQPPPAGSDQPAQSIPPEGASAPASQEPPVDVSLSEPPVSAPEFSDGEAADVPGQLSLHRINQSWPAVLSAVRERNPQTQGLLNSCKPLGIKNEVLILGFASDLIKSKMEKTEHLTHAQEVLAQVLGVSLKLRCIVSASAQSGKVSDLEGIDSDGMVAIALRDLGGEIVDVQ